MIHKKMLLIASYPIKAPQHGGQKRVKAFFDFYETRFEEVRFVGIFPPKTYLNYDPSDILLGQRGTLERAEKEPYLSDLISGEAIMQDINVRSRMAKLLLGYRPDMIQIEQIFPYAGLDLLLKDLNLRPKIIFSSHNIEYRMKANIYKTLKVPATKRIRLVEQIREMEVAASRNADLVIAVSEADAEVHRAMGAKRVAVIPNGIAQKEPSSRSIQYWHGFKKEKKIEYIMTFVGSAHPPNWEGFLRIVGEDTTFLPENTKIVLAGGIADYFRDIYKIDDPYHQAFWKNIIPLGPMSEDKLTGLIHESEVILLPITSGGGSNLKTAEAILSGKKVVSTKFAFRSFEKYTDLPNLYMAETSQRFRADMIKALSAKYKKRTAEETELARQVQWEYCLLPLKPYIEEVSKINFTAQIARYARAGARKLRVESMARRIIKLLGR